MSAATAKKPNLGYRCVELYVGFQDYTWTNEHFVYVPMDLMQGWSDEVTLEDVAVVAFERYIEKHWDESTKTNICFIGLYNDHDHEKPSKDDIQVAPRDVKKAADKRKA